MSLIKEAIIIRVPIIFVLNLAFYSNSKTKTQNETQVSDVLIFIRTFLALLLGNHLSFQVHLNGSIVVSWWNERSEFLIIKMLTEDIQL